MKPVFVKMLFVVLLLGIAWSCSKSSNTNTTNCTVSTGDAIPLTANQSVSYTASVTGTASITSISYQDSAGVTTVKNPSLPFSKTVNLKSGSTANITGTGPANSGEITVTSNGISLNTASCP